MQHAIRRKDYIMETAAALKLLEAGEYGVLAATGPDGWPYAAPLSYIKADDALLTRLAQKYLPDAMDKAPADIAKSLARTAVYGIKIELLTGKAKNPAKYAR